MVFELCGGGGGRDSCGSLLLFLEQIGESEADNSYSYSSIRSTNRFSPYLCARRFTSNGSWFLFRCSRSRVVEPDRSVSGVPRSPAGESCRAAGVPTPKGAPNVTIRSRYQGDLIGYSAGAACKTVPSVQRSCVFASSPWRVDPRRHMFPRVMEVSVHADRMQQLRIRLRPAGGLYRSNTS